MIISPCPICNHYHAGTVCGELKATTIAGCEEPYSKSEETIRYITEEKYEQLQQRLSTAESQYDELSSQNNALKNTVKLFYRKHCLNDDSIGWDELGDNLYNALAKTLGDKEFCKWLDTQSM